jgi:hypothetical protein
VDRISLGRVRQSSRAGACVPATESNLQQKVLTQSGAAPDCLQRPLRFRFWQQVRPAFGSATLLALSLARERGFGKNCMALILYSMVLAHSGYFMFGIH